MTTITRIEGDYGTEARRTRIRHENAKRGKSWVGRTMQATQYWSDTLTVKARQALLNQWSAQ